MEQFGVTVLEVEHASEMQADLRRKLQEANRRDGGRVDSVRATILRLVVSENYDRAKVELEDYVEFKTAYPQFQERVSRHVQHCKDLIQAIETKRNFPGLASLSLAKQQELHDRVMGHFEELKQNLKHIEGVERDHKLNDVRSTVWVIQAICYVTFGIAASAFLLDLQSGLLSTAIYVASILLDDTSTWIVSHLPFLK
jgi:hypothetical protein